jgi:3-oxoacyl-[acyl-carrier protein] reductase
MSVTYDFSGRRVIVTGGSRGIGRGIAEAFLRAGASVSICARSASALEEARAELTSLGPVHAAPCDLADPASIQAYVAEAAAAMGGIDILVNNVSSISRGDDEAAWLGVVSVDLMGNVRMCEAARPWLEASADAAIIHIGSITAFRVSKTAAAYAAIKSALRSYTASQALLLIEHGIRVNSVAPGATSAPGHFWEERRKTGDVRYLEAVKRQPTGRLGQPEDIARVVLFLASDASSWVIGQTIIADGGLVANGG